MATKADPFANPGPIQCQSTSSINQVPNLCQSNANPVPISDAKLVSIDPPSDVNQVPIHLQSVNPTPIQVNQCQLIRTFRK